MSTAAGFYFSSPRRTILARGPWDGPEPGPGAVTVGALPFAAGAPDALTEATDVTWDPPAPPGGPGRALPAGGAAAVPEPSPAEYELAVEKALVRLGDGDVDKVVLARTLRIDTPAPVEPAALLRRLAAHDPHAHVYAVPSGPGRTLVGASPELLVSRFGRDVASHPLAGSAARSADPAEDRRRADALLASAKDLREHAYVVRAVADGLRPYCADLDVPAEPSLVATATMWHLGTRITGRLADPGVTALTLARALHPTPAVCGTPAAAARDLIGELEPFDRGLYGGAVGWCDAAGDGEWAVAIRCAETGGDGLRLFAGAGIVAGSHPTAELAETTAKFGTMLRALGLDGEGR
ncbi:isochorismate synthase [Actinomadura parmotrematis]|uniref:isochorismate synthase n=1 Tax=Actinomadura parmotrematis TaxID=2864039 RepID=UPI0027E27F62|nr:isochorismate synthase [Actinomadura parmotrematis]